MDASSLLADIHLVPVVSIADESQAVPLASALYDAGMKAIEVTLRTGAALAAIESISRHLPEMLVGAGSIRRPGQLQQAVDAGAKFTVSPGSSTRLLEAAAEVRLPFVPGAVTASEMIVLLEHGYTLQKFFPAELSGGLTAIRALSAPLPEVRFFPTGGITGVLAREYLDCDVVACVGGSWFVPAERLAKSDYKGITDLAHQALAALDG